MNIRSRYNKIVKLLEVMSARHDQRVIDYCAAHPFAAHDVANCGWSAFRTKREVAMLHWCKQELVQLEARILFEETGVACNADLSEKIRLVAMVSRKLKIPRPVVRDRWKHIDELRSILAG